VFVTLTSPSVVVDRIKKFDWLFGSSVIIPLMIFMIKVDRVCYDL